MPVIAITPEELEVFIRAIQSFIQAQHEASASLQGAFNALGETWKDSKKDQFESSFQELLGILGSFKEEAEEQIRYLYHVISILEPYGSL
ncbi:WXG100 family type VII secretion target [Helicobacter suis]|uniref:WXG100 family type VII secretion target n=1 Tax=Helicobacter suis TaxID=104628 RepID=UPI0013D33DB5|nr:WXG100 family type VII secretion target [Helicobacter suis]